MKFLILTSILIFGCNSPVKPISLEINENIQNTQTVITSNACPPDMLEVKGNYCPEVSQKCLKWLDEDKNPTANGGIGPMRCEEFEKPSICLSAQKKYLHFCMDRFEYPNVNESYPVVGMNYYEAKKLASDNNKRLCTMEEFNLAGEGEDMHPYPYGDGFHRDCNVCNCDKPWKDYNKYPRSTWNEHDGGLNQGIKSNANSLCKSVYGVINLAGNYDEILDSEHANNVILSGGYWGPVRARVRPKTTAHGKLHSFYQLSTRFCLNINK